MFCDFGKRSIAFKNDLKFKIDEEDYDKYVKDKSHYSSRGYVMQNNVGLHRIIMGLKDQKELHIDHINHDTLDNRKDNLRIVTPQQNAYNKNVYKNNESGYTGVHLYKPSGKYMAYIKADGKRKHLGYYKTIEEAYKAYVRASHELHGEYAADRIKDIEVEPLEPVPKVYKSPKWSIENYHKNKPMKLRNQILRNIKKFGKTPKDSTIEKHSITDEEIKENMEAFKKANPEN